MLDRGTIRPGAPCGESTGNIGGRVLGTNWSRAHHPGPTQARGAAHGLTRWHADMLWSSDMVRRLEHCPGNCPTTRLPLNCTAQGVSRTTVRWMAAAGDLVAQPTPAGRDITEVRWGGGESIADVHARPRLFVMVVVAGAAPGAWSSSDTATWPAPSRRCWPGWGIDVAWDRSPWRAGALPGLGRKCAAALVSSGLGQEPQIHGPSFAVRAGAARGADPALGQCGDTSTVDRTRAGPHHRCGQRRIPTGFAADARWPRPAH